MTVSATTRKAGPFTGNGVTTAFPFTFKVFQASDLLVVQTDLTPTDTTLTLNTHYTVALNASQDSNPGGTVNMVTAPPINYLLTIGTNVPLSQSDVFTNNGGWYPSVLNDALDYLTILAQQLAEKVGRSLTLPFSTSSNVSAQLPPVAPGQLLGWRGDGLGIANMGAAGTGSSDLLNSVTVAGLANAVTCTTSSALALAANQFLWLTPTAKNTGATTLNRDNLGAKNVHLNGAALTGGEFLAGVPVLLEYDGTQYNIFANNSALGTFEPLGTGAVPTTVAAFLRGLVVDSIAALSLLTKGANMRLAVLGYYAAGDGGGGLYYYDSTDTTSGALISGSISAGTLTVSSVTNGALAIGQALKRSDTGAIIGWLTAGSGTSWTVSGSPTVASMTMMADNGGSTIVAADGGRWKLVANGEVNVKQFGAIGAGATGDYWPFWNACFHCYSTGDGLFIPAGNYVDGRVEVHGSFDVRGSGATVQYLGVGTTYIAGTGTGTSAAPTAWPIETSYDPNGVFTPTMYTLAATISAGAASFSVVSATGLAAGQYLFIGGNPTAASSASNYIPQDFEFVRISSVVGTTVNIFGKFKNSYTTIGTGAGAAAAFYSPGLAVNCKVSGIKLSTTTDAYQYVVRSSFNVKLDVLELIGASAAGASTFSENLRIAQWKIHNANGPLSTARGTVSTYFEDIDFTENTGGTSGLFIEESLYHVGIRGFIARNSGFSIRSLALATPALKRTVSVKESVFDNTLQNDSPFACGTAAGIDITVDDCTLAGVITTPASGPYPGVNGQALIWLTSNGTADYVKFRNTRFISTGAGPTWPLAASGAFDGGIGGFLGVVEFDSLCTFSNCYNAYMRPWIATLIGSTAAPTTPVTATAYYIRDGKKINAWFDFQAVNTTGATGNVQVTGLYPQSANNGMNSIGSCASAGLGSVATNTRIQAAQSTIQIINGTSWTALPMVAGTGKSLTGHIQFEAA